MRQFRVSSFEFRVSTLRTCSALASVGAVNSQLETRNSQLATGNSQLAAALTLWLGALLVAPAMATAQVMNDPMRPPMGQAGAETDIAGDTGGGSVLQSVMISPAMRTAIISGVMVKLGEKYGDAVLIKVAENEVVLKSGAGSQVLKLYPGVEKRDIAPVAVKTPSRKRKSGRSETDSAAPGSPATR